MSSSTPEQVPADPPGGDRTPRRRSSLPRLLVLASVLTVLLVAAVAIPAYVVHQRNHTALAAQQARVSGIPASVSTSLANLMVLSPLPGIRAPRFTLTDQNGHVLSLASLRGKVVVLQFMDPHCTDICPIVSAEFVKRPTTTWARWPARWCSPQSTSTPTTHGSRTWRSTPRPRP